MDFITIVFLIILLSLFWKKLNSKKNRINKHLEHIPGPDTFPVIGNVLQISGNSIEQLKNLMALQDKYGPISKIQIGPNKFYLFVSDPEFIEFITSSQKFLKKSVDYDLIRPWLKNGLLLSYGSYWQTRRKIITPTFHFKILEEFIPVFNSKSEILIENLSKQIDKDFDIHPFITAFTLDSICETAMGTCINAQQFKDHSYAKAVKTISSIYIKRKYSAWKQFDSLFKYSNDYKENCEALNIIQGFVKYVIEKRRNELVCDEKQKNTNNDCNDVGMKKRIAFLDLLLQSNIDGKPLTDEDIYEEVTTFMFAGHDTSATAMSFALYEIARDPHIQNRIVKELIEIFGNEFNKEPTIQDLNNMKYTELVIKETLRMYPPVPYVSRELEEDTLYKNFILPKGILISLFILHLHRRPDLFPEPEKFDPERFLNKEPETKNHFCYIPFSAGPRNCIGQKFAMYEMKLTLAKILGNFELLPTEEKSDLVLASEIILVSKTGTKLRLKRRKI